VVGQITASAAMSQPIIFSNPVMATNITVLALSPSPWFSKMPLSFNTSRIGLISSL
jgi:hypothetical protein